MRILKGYSKEERKELEEAKDNGFLSVIVLFCSIKRDDNNCHALYEKYYREDTNGNNQMARDIADYYAGVAKLPDKKYYVHFIKSDRNSYLNVDEANRHTNDTHGCITWDKAVYAIKALSKEANSKIIIPKVFDDWYKNHEISGLELYDAIEELHRCMEVWELGYASNIGMWISKNPKVNYRICIEALMNGYEVSDDYGIETVN